MSLFTGVIQFLKYWHIQIGVLSAFFLLLFSLTGIALNHPNNFGLDKLKISQTWLKDWYGLRANAPTIGFFYDTHYLAGNEEQWVLNGAKINIFNQKPIGHITWQALNAVATKQALYLFAWDGRLAEKLGHEDLPATPISKLGMLDDQLILETAAGMFCSEDAISWVPLLESNDVLWSKAQPLPARIVKKIKKSFLPSISLERVVLDIHSGRLFGRYGPIFMDAVAILLVIFSFASLWMCVRCVKAQDKSTKS